MATNNKDAGVPAAAAAVQQPTVSIDEFCTRLSETVVRPELIGAFAYSERAAGNLRATSEQFQARYTAFINKPV